MFLRTFYRPRESVFYGAQMLTKQASPAAALTGVRLQLRVFTCFLPAPGKSSVGSLHSSSLKCRIASRTCAHASGHGTPLWTMALRITLLARHSKKLEIRCCSSPEVFGTLTR